MRKKIMMEMKINFFKLISFLFSIFIIELHHKLNN